MTAGLPCPDWQARISALQDGELSSKERQRVEAHLATCPACTTTLAHYTADRARFTAAYAASTGGDALRTAVLEELRMSQPSFHTSNLTVRFRWLAAFAGVATIACVILAGVILLRTDLFPSATTIATSVPAAKGMGSEPSKKPPAPAAPTATPAPIVVTERYAVTTPPAMSPDSTIADSKRKVDFGYAKNRVGDRITNGYADTFSGSLAASGVASQGEEAKRNLSNPSLAAGGELNYGVQGGVRMAYNMDYALKVKNALAGARAAQKAIRKHGGYTVDFRYSAEKGETPTATFHGKIPAKDADTVLAEIEKLGKVRTVNIAGTDITDEIRWREDAINHQRSYDSDALKRELVDLGLQHTLVDFSATFTGPEPTLPHAAEITKNVLKYALLALVTLLTILLALAAVIGPIYALRAWRKRRDLPLTEPTEIMPMGTRE